MSEIINVAETVLLNNIHNVIKLFKAHNTPLALYLKTIDFLNEYRRINMFNKDKFKYVGVIANNQCIKLHSIEELEYLTQNAKFNENECVSIYNSLISPVFVKDFINSTWLECILERNGKFKPTFAISSYENVSAILTLMMRVYNDIDSINKSILVGKESDIVKSFKDTEYLIENTELIKKLFSYFENKIQNRIPVYVKCFLYNYQYINYFNKYIDNQTGKITGSMEEFNRIEESTQYKINVNSSNFNLYMPMISYIKDNITEYINVPEYIHHYYNLETMYMNNGLLMLGDCYEGMGHSTHLVYDVWTGRFLMFSMYGSNGYDCEFNDNKLQSYLKNSALVRLVELENYNARFKNEDIVNMVLHHEYVFMYHPEGKSKIAFIYND
jgi:hypothetical protein